MDSHQSSLASNLVPRGNSQVFSQSCLVVGIYFLLVILVVELSLLLASLVSKDLWVSCCKVVHLSKLARVNILLRARNLKSLL